MARTCVHSFPRQGSKRYMVTELRTGAMLALPVPLRDVLAHYSTGIPSTHNPAQNRPPHFTWASTRSNADE